MALKSSTKLSGNQYELTIVIDAETFGDAVMRAYRKNAKKINVPGFRKGHAPKNMIEKFYGKDFFYNEALDTLYPKEIRDAAESLGAELVDSPSDYKPDHIDESGAEFRITITVKPDCEIDEYKGLKAPKPEVNVTDEMVDAELALMRERGARLVDAEDQAAEMGNTAVIDFAGYLGDEPFEGGEAAKFSLELGSGQFIPGFEEQVAGHKKGEQFDVNVTFPEDYQAAELAGQSVRFDVTLHEVKRKELPELDDEFAKDVSEFDTLDALKGDLHAKLAHRMTHDAEDAFEMVLVGQLAEKLKAEVPDVMIRDRIDERVRDFESRLKQQGIALKTYLEYTGGTEEEFRETFREAAERQVKVRLALEVIAAKEHLGPTEEEIGAEYTRMAEMYKTEVEKLKAAIPAKDVAQDLGVRNAIDFVKKHAIITSAGDIAKENPDDTTAEHPAETEQATEAPKKRTRSKKKAAEEAAVE